MKANLINTKDIKEIRGELGFSQEMFAKVLGVSTRNLIRWENKNSIHPNLKSTRVILKIKELSEKLLNTFDEKNIEEWLNTPNESLGGRTPIREIISAESPEKGIQGIIDLLGNMEWGNFS
ncbi:MAG: helix-turn-helix domain-containing protein [Actinobacteria bacterium]|nr:helix-turn-helix domain-containing protein [Actinomycetota bacterium]